MTDKEHALMKMMFTRQAMYIQMLLDMLKTNGIIQDDDVPAFDSVVINNPDSADAFVRVTGQYSAFAKQLGLELPELPPSPASKVQPQ
jgi:hypothetical protein